MNNDNILSGLEGNCYYHILDKHKQKLNLLDVDGLSFLRQAYKIYFYYTDVMAYIDIKSKIKDTDKFKLYEMNTFLLLMSDRSIVFICRDYTSCKEALSYMINNSSNSNVKNYLRIADNNMSQFFNYDKNEIDNIKTHYYSVFVKSNKVQIYTTISPDTVILDGDIVRKLKEDSVEKITNITICIDSDNNITSVFLDANHPNSKNGSYCLGSYKNRKLTLETVNELVSNIKIYDLRDCYYVPNNLNDLLEETV